MHTGTTESFLCRWEIIPAMSKKQPRMNSNQEQGQAVHTLIPFISRLPVTIFAWITMISSACKQNPCECVPASSKAEGRCMVDSSGSLESNKCEWINIYKPSTDTTHFRAVDSLEIPGHEDECANVHLNLARDSTVPLRMQPASHPSPDSWSSSAGSSSARTPVLPLFPIWKGCFLSLWWGDISIRAHILWHSDAVSQVATSAPHADGINQSLPWKETEITVSLLQVGDRKETQPSIVQVLLQHLESKPGPLLKSPSPSPSIITQVSISFLPNLPQRLSRKVIAAAWGRKNHQNKHCSHTSLICLPTHGGDRGKDFVAFGKFFPLYIYCQLGDVSVEQNSFFVGGL